MTEQNPGGPVDAQRAPDQPPEVVGERIGDHALTGADVVRLNRIEAASALDDQPIEPPDEQDKIPDLEVAVDDPSQEGAAPERNPELASVEAIGRTGRAPESIDKAPPPNRPKSSLSAQDEWPIQGYTSGTVGQYLQGVSDDCRESGVGHYSAGEIPINKDDGRGSVAVAKTFADRTQRLDAQQVEHGRKICEVDADTGLRTHGVLTALRRDHPDQYNHPDFKAVVLPLSDKHAAAMRDSGIFDEFPGKVEIGKADPENPQVPEGTLFAMVTGADHAPVYRLTKDDEGKVVEAQAATFMRGDAPVVTATTNSEGAPAPKVVHPRFWLPFETASGSARNEYAPTVAPRIYEGLIQVDPASPKKQRSDLERLDEDTADFMREWPEVRGSLRNYSPALEHKIEVVVSRLDPAGLCEVEGFMREGDTAVAWRQLSVQEGLTVHNVIEEETLQRGARAGDEAAKVYMPPRAPCAYNYALVDRINNSELSSQSVTEYRRTVTAPGNPGRDILENARSELLAERNGRNGGSSAVENIRSQYNAYIEEGAHKHALPELDVDLARGLARVFREHGYWEESVAFADRAIAIAPHVDASARVEKAKAQIMLGNLDGAGQELAIAHTISPRNPAIHRARAQLATVQGEWEKYAEALTDEQRDAAIENPEVIVKSWRAICESLERDAVQSANDLPVIVRAERVEYDEASGAWVVTSRNHSVRPDIAKRARVAVTAHAAAAALHEYLGYVEPARKQWQDKVVQPLIDTAERNRWRATMGDPTSPPIPMHELRPGLQLTGRVALEAAAYDMAQGYHGTVEERPPVTEIVPKATGIVLGHVVDRQSRQVTESTANLTWRDLNTHVVGAGATGAGKTTTAQNMLARVAEAGLTFWVYDMGERSQHSNLSSMGIGPVTVIRFGDVDQPAVSLGLLAPEPGYPVQKHIDRVKGVLARTNQGHEPFPQLASSALQDLYADYGYPVRRSDGTPNTMVLSYPSVPSLADFAAGLLAAADKAEYGQIVLKDVKGFLKVRGDQLQVGPMGLLMGTAHLLDIARLHQQNVVWDFTGLTGDDKKLAANWLLDRQGEHLDMLRRAGGDTDRSFTHLSLFDEAQVLVGAAKNYQDAVAVANAEVHANAVTQRRGQGEGQAYFTQTPEDLEPTILKNAGTLLVHRLPSGTSRAAVMDTMGVSPEDDDWKLPISLKDGEVMLSNRAVKTTGHPPLLVKMPEPLKPNKPTQQPDPLTRGSLKPPEGGAYTLRELEAAEVAVAQPEHARWVLFATGLVLARETRQTLPAPPAEMQRQWEEKPPRERSLLLDTAVRQAVDLRAPALRQHYSPDKLRAAALYDAMRMLHGVPLAGSDPGTGLEAPELARVMLAEQLTNPRADIPPGPGAYVPPVGHKLPGYEERPGLSRAGELQETLERLEGTVEQAPKRQGAAFVALMGRDNGATLLRALDAMGNEPDLQKQILQLAEEMGLRERGEPTASWLEELILMARRTIWQNDNPDGN